MDEFPPEYLRQRYRIPPEDRAAIDAAVAAGRVTKIRPGVESSCSSWWTAKGKRGRPNRPATTHREHDVAAETPGGKRKRAREAALSALMAVITDAAAKGECAPSQSIGPKLGVNMSRAIPELEDRGLIRVLYRSSIGMQIEVVATGKRTAGHAALAARAAENGRRAGLIAHGIKV